MKRLAEFSLVCEGAISNNVDGLLQSLETEVPPQSFCFFATKLVLWEMLSNIYKYSGDPEKMVSVELATAEADVQITIEDFGAGFNWGAYMDCEPSCEDAGYRGLFLVKQYSKELKFDSAGKKTYIVIERR
ncbi:anti-sigma regulatory factor (Ser/Thr protein kinase) [Bacillus ectoiniformans]|uniref:ATP-binding protein n=1 Tax=Bacillus ectoiniformans TaxID=1494429 RepID=UPI00195EF5D9|nr:ATP-binding protein [Bacillus ectoiniformans]MBM7647904.1 anti-sigma regulatory factor (Ser/Thr protein kinase) [Bacillus ectoiniformans]